MQTFFHPDSELSKALSWIFDRFLLNVLWLVFCIPVVTIGASTTALYHVTLHIVNDQSPSSIIRDFVESFRSDFKQATRIWLLLLLPAVLLTADLYAIISGYLPNTSLMLVFFLLPCMAFLAITAYVFAYAATFEDTARTSIKNAALIAIANFPRTVLLILLNLIPLFVFMLSLQFFLRTLLLWGIGGIAALVYVDCALIQKAFCRFLPKEPDDSSSD